MNEEPAASLLASLIEGNRTTTSKYTISKRSFFPAEREALVRIYEACGGEGWRWQGRQEQRQSRARPRPRRVQERPRLQEYLPARGFDARRHRSNADAVP